ncbi:hypothetical protein AAF712_005374 [Marasmius tenuissimus]|uniref:non-specific serine/threonine protein kinase n=1 Tax=Marasmius tenuissimus TaxID=585030 RepID=A0ABR3A3U6_9AGAR
MIGTRTKRVNTYGKRSQRIVNVSEEGAITRTRRAPAPSIFDDMPPTQLAPMASKMKNRENNVVKRPKHISPKLITKKQSPLRQKAMLKTITQSHPALAQKPSAKAIDSDLPATPSRAPFATYSPNLPNSPAIIQRSARIPPAHTTPLSRSIKPFVDTDIILMDDDGHTVSHERRVSSQRAEAPDDNLESPSCSDSDAEIQLPRQAKKPTRKNPVIILSDDDSSSEDEEIYGSPRRTGKASNSTRLPPRPSTKSVKVEVLIPPPSSPLAKLMKKDARPVSPDPPTLPPATPPKYQHTLSPIVKPRQLTPLRPHRKTLFTPPSPPSPVSDSDLDVVLELSGLSLGSSVDSDPPPSFPEYLRPLLEECQQVKSGLYEFSAFIDTFPYDEVVRSSSRPGTNLDRHKFRKVGEASYSEVFGIGDVVLKVIPIRDETVDGPIPASEDDGPFPSEAKDVLKEIIVTRAMGEVDARFVKLLRTYVVKGRYPQLLLELWDDYLEKNNSESVRPDTFGVSQAYVIIALPNGGPDLESFKFTNATKTGWRQAASVFWQVTKALAHAEQLVSFEHRDLHWGQILLKPVPVPSVMPMQERVNQVAKVRPPKARMDDPVHGIQVTLIDLGLARMDAGDGAGGEMVHWTALDDEIFMGQGDYQFDVYRLMKEQHRDHWEAFNPLTNVMWLHYLLVKLLKAKRLKPPTAPKKGQLQLGSHSSAAYFSEKECYDCLLDLEQWLRDCLSNASARARAFAKGSGKKRPKPNAGHEPNINPLCAGEIVEYGIKKGWIVARHT